MLHHSYHKHELLTTVSQKLQHVWNIDQYISDAKKAGHKECAKLFEQIKKDEARHAAMLRDLVKMKVKHELYK